MIGRAPSFVDRHSPAPVIFLGILIAVAFPVLLYILPVDFADLFPNFADLVHPRFVVEVCVSALIGEAEFFDVSFLPVCLIGAPLYVLYVGFCLLLSRTVWRILRRRQ